MTNYLVRADQATIAVNVISDITVDSQFADRTLYSLRRNRFVMPEYRLRQGIPEPVPPVDVRSHSYATLYGATVTNTRPSPMQVAPTSVARWLPTDATWNGLTWSALAGGARSLKADITRAPTITHDFHYYVGKELVTRDALLFSTDLNHYLFTNFTPYLEAEWTMLIVACPLPPKRNALGVSDYYGVIEHITEPLGLRQYATAIQYYQGSQANSAQMALGSQTPVIYAISATSTTIRFYRRILGVTWVLTLARTGLVGDYPMDIIIGGESGAPEHSANMALMEVNFYNTRLIDADFEIEASNIYSAYGNYAGVS
jgi:hypothetical protein